MNKTPYREKLEFYVGLENSGTDKKLPHTRNIFISAATLWDLDKEKWSHPKLPSHENFMLDCGGFSFFNKYEKNDYPFGPEKLAHLARDIRPDYVATIDYPCEPELLEQKGWTVGRNIRKTVENAEKCLDQKIPGQWMPVIQGYKLEHYKHCFDLMEEKDLIRPYMAVGSVCARESVEEMTEIVTGINDYIVEKGYNIKLHFFGLSLNTIKKGENYARIYSSDSNAWKWNHHAPDADEFMPRNEQDKLDSYPVYMKKIQKQRDKFAPQKGLEQVNQ